MKNQKVMMILANVGLIYSADAVSAPAALDSTSLGNAIQSGLAYKDATESSFYISDARESGCVGPGGCGNCVSGCC